MFKNMKVGARLALGFISILVMLSVLAATALMNIRVLNGDINELVNEAFPKTVWANNMNEGINEIARLMRNSLLMTEPTQIQGELKRIEEAREKIKANLEKLQVAVKSEKGKELLKTIGEARAKFIGEQNDFIKLVILNLTFPISLL